MAHPFISPRPLLAAVFSVALILSGCGGGSSGSTTGSVTILHQAGGGPTADAMGMARQADVSSQAAAPLPDGVDSMQVKFLDADGKVVYGPVEVKAAPAVTVNDVPLTATSTNIDYLRNGGYALDTDDEPIAWSGAAASVRPTPEIAAASTTQWKASVDANGVSRLDVAVEGGKPTEFLMRGVGYSPAPIGFSNKDGPSFGDIFWDTPGGFLDFERVWKRDIETIRSKGFNAVRTYSLIAHFINDNGTTPPPEEFNNPKSLRIRQHKKFLDEAWNNGNNPVYVIVGIPMPDTIYIKSVYDNPQSANLIRYWDDNFTATVEQMKDHPAVIGFTIFNEIGGTPDYAGDPVRATHYWSQVQKYSERAKAMAPGKLVGWAFNDDPSFASQTVKYRQQYAKAIDFYGVNAFQAQQLGTTLDPWLKSAQGDTARPVILTEFGLPATGHRDTSQIAPYVEPGLTQAKTTIAGREGVAPGDVSAPGGFDGSFIRNTESNALSIYEDASTVRKTADAVRQLIPVAFSHPIVAGMVYFEWSDEWWKQDSYINFFIPKKANKPVYLVNLAISRQEGGTPNSGFPNGYWDEEGFGLNSIALNGRTASQVYTDQEWGTGGNVQVDKLTPRTELMNAVVETYKSAAQTRKKALNLN